jgi:hypothetical protein
MNQNSHSNWINKWGLARKNSSSVRRRWPKQPDRFDPASLIFMDESGVKTNRTLLYSRSKSQSRISIIGTSLQPD